ncbi:DUF3096 domain-containing protein [bacterium]|nr:DUF3096 domain-containing protein [bacterium]MDC0322304.1 DUF3096 domain-containing protein [Verrucomicrobiales bacterium]
MKNISPLISIVAGVLILIKPSLLALVVAIFLIISGVLALAGKK